MMKTRAAVMAALLAATVVAPTLQASPAFSATSVHASILQGTVCGAGSTKRGNAAVTRNGTHVRVAVNGALPAGDGFQISLYRVTSTLVCEQIGSASSTFASNSAGYFQAAATFHVPTRIAKFAVDLFDTTAHFDNATQFMKVAP